MILSSGFPAAVPFAAGVCYNNHECEIFRPVLPAKAGEQDKQLSLLYHAAGGKNNERNKIDP
jgi:hypothetical protein